MRRFVSDIYKLADTLPQTTENQELINRNLWK